MYFVEGRLCPYSLIRSCPQIDNCCNPPSSSGAAVAPRHAASQHSSCHMLGTLCYKSAVCIFLHLSDKLASVLLHLWECKAKPSPDTIRALCGVLERCAGICKDVKPGDSCRHTHTLRPARVVHKHPESLIISRNVTLPVLMCDFLISLRGSCGWMTPPSACISESNSSASRGNAKFAWVVQEGEMPGSGSGRGGAITCLVVD